MYSRIKDKSTTSGSLPIFGRDFSNIIKAGTFLPKEVSGAVSITKLALSEVTHDAENSILRQAKVEAYSSDDCTSTCTSVVLAKSSLPGICN
jgi:hypothetical protein